MTSGIEWALNTFFLCFSLSVIYLPPLVLLDSPPIYVVKATSLIIRGGCKQHVQQLTWLIQWKYHSPFKCIMSKTRCMAFQIHTYFISSAPYLISQDRKWKQWSMCPFSLPTKPLNHQVLLIQHPKYLLNLSTFFPVPVRYPHLSDTAYCNNILIMPPTVASVLHQFIVYKLWHTHAYGK